MSIRDLLMLMFKQATVAPSVPPSLLSYSALPNPSWSHTVASGTSLLVLKIGITGANTITGVSWNGTPATLLKWQPDNSAAGTRKNNSAIYYIKAPTPGTGVVSVTTSAATNVVVVAENYTNTNAINPFGLPVSINTTTSSVGTSQAIPSASGDLCTDVVLSRYTNTPGANQVLITDNGGSPYSQESSYAPGQDGSTTVSWTWGNTGVYAATWIGVALKPAS